MKLNNFLKLYIKYISKSKISLRNDIYDDSLWSFNFERNIKSDLSYN